MLRRQNRLRTARFLAGGSASKGEKGIFGGGKGGKQQDVLLRKEKTQSHRGLPPRKLIGSHKRAELIKTTSPRRGKKIPASYGRGGE